MLHVYFVVLHYVCMYVHEVLPFFASSDPITVTFVSLITAISTDEAINSLYKIFTLHASDLMYHVTILLTPRSVVLLDKLVVI
jgi:hypothetical protein